LLAAPGLFKKDTNLALHYYHHDNAFTSNGVLNITTELKKNNYKAFNEKTKQFYADTKYVQTGMLQGWNKFCYIGGVAEIRAQLPGAPDKGGLWPARKLYHVCVLVPLLVRKICLLTRRYIVESVWLLGNLARATFVGSSDFMWPYSFNMCDPKHRLSQEINACSKVNHYGMTPFFGRGSPEIDIIESMQGDTKGKLPSTHIQRPYQSASFQVCRNDGCSCGDNTWFC